MYGIVVLTKGNGTDGIETNRRQRHANIDTLKALIVQFVCRPRPARHTSTLNFSVLLCTKNIKIKH